MRRRSIGVLRILALSFLLHFSLSAQERMHVLTGNRHPLARAEFEVGPTEPGFPMQRMTLALEPSGDRRAALEAYLEALHDPGSPDFHRWLEPEDFEARFGVSRDDLDRVTRRGHRAVADHAKRSDADAAGIRFRGGWLALDHDRGHKPGCFAVAGGDGHAERREKYDLGAVRC